MDMKNILALLITVVLTTQHILAQKQNLVQNGTFENVERINSDFEYKEWWGFGYYTITDQVASKWGKTFVDPVGSTGKFLIVDVNPSKKQRLWYDSITIKPNTTYSFTCLAANVFATIESSNMYAPRERTPALQLNVNEKRVSRVINLYSWVNNDGKTEWKTLSGKFTSGPDQTRIEISIIDMEWGQTGNDVAIDNISFIEIATVIPPIAKDKKKKEPVKEVAAVIEPVVVKEEPVVVKEEPVPVKVEPEVVKEEPVVVKEEPVVIKEEPVVVKEEPVVVKTEPVKPVVEKKIVPTPVKKEVEKKPEPVIAKVIEKKPVEAPVVKKVKPITPPKEKKILLQPVKKEKKLELVVVAKIDPPKKIEKKKEAPVKKVELVVTPVSEVVTKPVEVKKDSVFATASVSFKKDMNKQMIQVGQKLELSHIYFERGKSALLNTSMPELNDLVSFMNKYPTVRIRLEGHTDNQGNPLANKELSENRVKETKKYLVEHGIAEDRIEWVGYGGERALNSNRVEALRKLNRRVEVVIIGK
jgi:outer membrane protein OmpA-like peptidoglycan-associated protein